MAAPLKLKRAFSLLSLGVAPTSVTFATATLSSDRAVTIRDQPPGKQPTLVILHTASPSSPTRRPFSADAALLHPQKDWLAVRVGVNVSVIDLASKKKLYEAVLPDAVAFWHWIGDDVLAIVTLTAVFHWQLSAEPQVVFERHDSLLNSQIIAYSADASQKWLAVTALSAQQNGVAGHVQLFSCAKNMSQILSAHAATFAKLMLDDYAANLFLFASRTENEETGKVESLLRIIEVGGSRFGKISTEIYYPPEFAADFPIALHVSSKYPTIVYLITKMGYLHLYDLETAKCIYMNRISETTLFATAPHTASGGLIGINRQGNVLLVSVNPDAIVPYVRNKLGDEELAVGLASRNGFAGAESGFADSFEDALEEGDYKKAAMLAADSPGGFLRTVDTIQRFRSLPADGPAPPVLVYFQTCLGRGKLNNDESVEFAKQLMDNKKTDMLEKWIKEDKLEFTEAVGDVIRPKNPTLALAVFIKAKAHEKVMQCMIQTGQTSKIALYAKKVGMKVTHRDLVEMAANYNPQAALDIANNASNALVLVDPKKKKESIEDINKMVDMFLSKGMLNEATAHAMDHLTDEDPEEGPVQTKVLKACLANAPAVADGILSQDIWHQFDSFSIAMLCERSGLFQHALEHYSDLSDVKRVITNTHVINPDFILNYFGTIHPDDQLEVLKELIVTNPRANIRLCVNVAAKYTDSMGGPLNVIPVFESVPKVPDALYYYLGAVVGYTDVPEVHNRFIKVAVELHQYEDAHKVTRESNYYDPEGIKSFLKYARPKDPRPLINVCDRFGFVDEMVDYFVKYRQVKFIQGYVQRINPLQCPAVVGALLDNRGMREADVKKMIMSVKNMVPVDDLVDAVQSRGKINLLLEFLESRLADGSTEASVHTGLAKVYIDTNRNAQHFLETNAYYDSREVGRFCTRRDPYLAFIAYRRGECDEEVLEVTNDNSLFREQAMYAVDRADSELWGKIFDEANPFRRLVIDQVISTAMPECKRPDKVSAAVKAFLTAGMPEVLMEMLEKIVVQTSNTAFSRNSKLQNLLILTAIGAAPERVMEYVRRLDNYDGADVAPSCIDAGLFEEAYTIYYKFEKYDDALDVLLEHIKDFDRAQEFAIRLNRPDVWLRLGVAQVENGFVADGIRSLMRAKDVSQYAIVVEASRYNAESNDDFKMISKFMRVARKKIREPESALRSIDTELVYALCRLNALTDVEEFIITVGHKANLEEVGDRCFDIELYQAAKMMFRAVPEWSKLAHTHIMLKEYKEAVYAAKKANKIPTWRIVCFGCVDGLEFRLAASCAMRLLVETEEMQECIEYYEDRGHFGEILDVLEIALNLPRAHNAMFTETAVLKTKYREESVLNFCRLWHGRFTIPKVIRACTRAHLWDSVVFLHVQYNEFDNAADLMMDHSPTAFTASEFLDVISRVGTLNTMYRSIDFYLGEQPELLEDLLNVLSPRIDGSRAVGILQRARARDFGPLGCLPFAVKYLEKIQSADVPEVNEALNEVYLTSGDTVSLRNSVKEFKNFDQIKLARRLQDNEALEFRRISGYLLARNGRYEQAIELAKKDVLYYDMIDAIAQSEDQELAETYAEYFAENQLRECFAALLYACFNFFPPDVAMEYVWMGALRDFAMPFMIQTLAEAGSRLTGLEEERKTKREIEQMKLAEEEEDVVDESVLLYGLQDYQQQPLLTYYQADGGVVGGLAWR
ncbi:Clathrin heavy chain [Gracilaria domingensis]|nr:Clathrin heavy chain [Gracilaria domingensis]